MLKVQGLKREENLKRVQSEKSKFVRKRESIILRAQQLAISLAMKLINHQYRKPQRDAEQHRSGGLNRNRNDWLEAAGRDLQPILYSATQDSKWWIMIINPLIIKKTCTSICTRMQYILVISSVEKHYTRGLRRRKARAQRIGAHEMQQTTTRECKCSARRLRREDYEKGSDRGA